MKKHKKLVSILLVSLIVMMAYFNIAYGKNIGITNVGSDGNNKTTSIISPDVNMDVDMYSKTKYPYSPICSIITKFKSKNGHIVSIRSTGQLVSEDKILTVAHNFTLDSHWLGSILAQADSLNTMDTVEISSDLAYNSRDTDETCKKLVWEFGSFEGIEVDFAYDIENKQHSKEDLYTINKQDIHINKSFVYGQPNFDVAVLITDNAIGRKYGWFGLIDTIYNNQRYSFTGYDTNAFKNVAFTSNTGYFDTTLNNCDNYTYWYKTGTDFLGFSGTALKMKSRWGNDTRVAAIHYGKNSDGKQIGIRMTKELIEWIVGLSKSEQENYLDFSGYNPTGEVYQIEDKNKILTKEEKERYPYSTTCRIVITYEKDGRVIHGVSTGQLIAKNTVLTCAHGFFVAESQIEEAIANTQALGYSENSISFGYYEKNGDWHEIETPRQHIYGDIILDDDVWQSIPETQKPLKMEEKIYFTDSKYFKSIDIDFTTKNINDRLKNEIIKLDSKNIKVFNNFVEKGQSPYSNPYDFMNPDTTIDDIAIIKLDDDLGYKYGWLGLDTEDIHNTTFELVGYPYKENKWVCYFERITSKIKTFADNRMISYSGIESPKGTSGGAIKTVFEGKVLIHGIQRGVVSNSLTPDKVEYSYGRKITSDIVDWLKSEGVFD